MFVLHFSVPVLLNCLIFCDMINWNRYRFTKKDIGKYCVITRTYEFTDKVKDTHFQIMTHAEFYELFHKYAINELSMPLKDYGRVDLSYFRITKERVYGSGSLSIPF